MRKRKKDYYREAICKEYRYLTKALKLSVRRTGFRAFGLYESIYEDLIESLANYLESQKKCPKSTNKKSQGSPL